MKEAQAKPYYTLVKPEHVLKPKDLTAMFDGIAKEAACQVMAGLKSLDKIKEEYKDYPGIMPSIDRWMKKPDGGMDKRIQSYQQAD